MSIQQRQLVSNLKIGKQFENCLFDWGIEQVYASPNEGALRYLTARVKTYRDDALVLNGDYLQGRCCTLNLIITNGLKELKQSIVSVRNAIKYVRSSTSRMQSISNSCTTRKD